MSEETDKGCEQADDVVSAALLKPCSSFWRPAGPAHPAALPKCRT